MSTVYSYGGGSNSVSIKTRAKLGPNGENLTSAASYGKIVKQWASSGLNMSDSQSANLTALQATSAGTFAVKYHMDYSRVLEDALDAYVVSKATQVMYYAGTVDLSALNGALTPQDTKDVLGAIGGFALDGTSLKSGGYYLVTDSTGVGVVDGVTQEFAVSILDGQSISVAAGDAFIVNSTGGLDKIDNVDPSVKSANTDEISVSKSGSNEYTVGLAYNYKANVTSAIAAAKAEVSYEVTLEREGRSQAVSALQTAVEAADALLSGSVSAEVERALAAEALITSAYTDADSALQSAYQAADLVLSGSISSEAERALAAEALLSTSISQEVTRALAAESDLTTAYVAADSALETAYQAADALLSGSISQEISDRAEAITAEAERADAYALARMMAESNRASEAEMLLQSAITAEVSRATAAEAALEAAYIAADVVVAADALGLVQGETMRATGVEAGLQTSLDGEVARATAAEAALETAIGNEAIRALAAEGAEQERASAVEALLSTSISSEATRAQEAEANIASYAASQLAYYVGAETTRAQTAETALATAFNASVKSTVDRFRILEAFVYATEQFVEMTSDGSTVLDFYSTLQEKPLLATTTTWDVLNVTDTTNWVEQAV